MLPKHILVPVDFLETSTKALDYALDLAAKVGAEVTALHAYVIPVVGFPDGALIATAEMASRILDASQKALQELIEPRKARGVKIHVLLHQDEPRTAVLKVCKEVGADLIVMGTHGRSGLPRALLGSVAEGVLRRADVPVLILRGPE
ncbi:MAG: universal stress protein [Myxococcales bacterium]|nr:universal stress protein [Myxococcales bacterium]MBL8719286.1 universal stress protein [Myxococcales bacterium]